MTETRFFRSTIASILAASITLVGSEACVTTRIDDTKPTTSQASSPRPASLRAVIYENRSTVKKNVVYAGPVHSKLMRLEPLPAEIVFESSDSAWSVEELAPGKYRLDVSRGGAGKEGEFGTKTFKVRPGDTVAARTILHDTRGVVWACVGIALGIGIAVVAVEASKPIVNLNGLKLSRGNTLP